MRSARDTGARRSAGRFAAAMIALWCMVAINPAQAQSWVVRDLGWTYPTPYRTNADVMVDAAGNVTVVSTLPLSPSAGIPLIAELNAGQPFLNDRSAEVVDPLSDLSGQLGPDGLLQIAARRHAYRSHIQDLGAWGAGGLQVDLYPDGSPMPIGRNPTLALDDQGIPNVAWFGSSYAYWASRFDPAVGEWSDPEFIQNVGNPYSRSAPAVAFDSQNHRLAALELAANPSFGQFEVQRQTDGVSSTLYSDDLTVDRGVSIAAGPNDEAAFAYIQGHTVKVVIQTAQGTTVHNLTNVGTDPQLLPRSLTFDANGDPAIVIGHRSTSSDNAILARYVGGAWQTETLPTTATGGTITFDAANNPYIATYGLETISLLGKTIVALPRGDFDVDSDVDADDVNLFVQAVKQQSTYRAAYPAMCDVDFWAIGDFNENGEVTEHDARAFVDGLATDPVPGLANRTAGYVALDQANDNGSFGEDDINFFNTTLATPKPYAPGDSRGDLSGETLGTANGVINDLDIDYLLGQINAAMPDRRADLNDDGQVDSLDADVLVEQILGTAYGDANLDALVDIADLQTLAGTFGSAGAWITGDFDGDGAVTIADLQLMAGNFGFDATVGALAVSTSDPTAAANSLNGQLLTIPEPASLALLGPASVMLRRRR